MNQTLNCLGPGGRRRILENGNLIINPVGMDDEGMYVCIASNSMGTEESHGRLIVMRKYTFLLYNSKFFIFTYYNCIYCLIGGPVFVEQLSPQIRSTVNRDLLLRCQAVSDELLDIAYIWTHNNMPLLNSNSELIGHIVSISLNTFFKNP